MKEKKSLIQKNQKQVRVFLEGEKMPTFRPRIPIRDEDKKEVEKVEPRVLAKEGVWLVPPSERPVRWEKMGLREAIPSVQNKKEGLC